MTHGCNLFAEQPRRTTAEKLHGWEIFSSKSKPFENHRHNSSNHVSWIHLNTVVLNGPHEYWAFNRCGYIAKNNCIKRRCNLFAILPLRRIMIERTIENTAAEEATPKNKKGTNNYNDYATATLTPTSMWARKAQSRAGMYEHKHTPTKTKHSWTSKMQILLCEALELVWIRTYHSALTERGTVSEPWGKSRNREERGRNREERGRNREMTCCLRTFDMFQSKIWQSEG